MNNIEHSTAAPRLRRAGGSGGWKLPIKFRLLFPPLVLALSGCGGGGGGGSSGSSGTGDSGGTGGTADITAPTVVSFAPTNMAADAEPNGPVSATFSEDMFAITVDGTSFTLQDASGEVSGTVSFDELSNIASFTPDARLTMLGDYTADLSAGITDLAGNALAPTDWSFSVRDGSWSSAKAIETDDAGDAINAQIAIDAAGNALAVWEQYDGMHISIWANRYEAGGWGSAELIEADDASDAFDPQIAIDASGNAMAAWSQPDDVRISIWANRYEAGGWGSAELIETGDGLAFFPQIAIDAAGNALAVWIQDDGPHFSIWANHFEPGSLWGTAELIETENAGDANSPQIAFDPAGNALAVWDQDDGTRKNIWANRKESGGTWGTAELVETDNTSDAFSPQLAIDATGKGLAVWAQSDGTYKNIWANQYVASKGGWGSPQLIETDIGDAFDPHIVFDPAGNALAVWEQDDGMRLNIWANRFVAVRGWGSAELIEADDAGDGRNPQIAIDAAGNALAVWKQDDGTRQNIRANRYVTGSWGSAELIETDDADDAEDPQIAIDASGNALAVWEQSDGAITNIRANRFE